ncbi:MAG: aspartyl-tRNA(Asn)/glutamyl-tRNA(Gln) amidotransferase subunit A [Candidatus Azotimanducaceae bacterium]
MTDLHLKTIKEMSVDLANGEYSSVELTQHFLNQIEKEEPKLNCFISTFPEQAIKLAQQSDSLRNEGSDQPLLGIPIAHKDIFCTKGQKTSAGSMMLDSFISPYNATVVEKLASAGTISIGKANMDEFAMGSSNEHSAYGNALNPWDLTRVPGGSSGGSAAAVAAGMCAAATGTDTGGSIRQPAAFCGVTGLKPTYGCISRYGIIAFASSLDQAGPITKTAEDAAIMLQAMAGFDPKDSTSIDQQVPDYTKNINDSIKGKRIGICREYFAEGLDTDIEAAIQVARQELEKLGAEVTEVSLPNTEHAIPAYYVIASAECSANLSRYDGVRFGHRCDNPTDIADLIKRSRTEGFGNEVKNRIMVGTFALSAGYYDAYYRKAQQVRRLIKNDFLEAFKEVDLILGPTTPSTAFKIGEKSNDPVSMYLEDIYTISVNLAGLPAISMPVGFVGNLPVGMQLIGPYHSEALLLNVAHQYQRQTDWHTKTPDVGWLDESAENRT